MEAVKPVVRNSPTRRYIFNAILYVFTITLIAVFIYFIYKYVSGTTSTETTLILKDKIDASKHENSKYDIRIPSIFEGGEFTINFWIHITGYNYRLGTRKHLVEIYSTGRNANRFSTIIIALGAFKPTLMVRAHTAGSTSTVPSGNKNYGITDCSGGESEDCSGGTMNGFTKLTDTNYTPQNNVNDNTLFQTDLTQFFRPMQIDEPSSTCDVKDLPLQKWSNICVTMLNRTLDVYLKEML